MPVMNGMEASRKIRAIQAEGLLTRHLPILGVSANVRGPQVQAMKDSGMVRPILISLVSNLSVP